LTVVPVSMPDADKCVKMRRVHAVRTAAAVAKRHGHVARTASAAILHGLPVREVPPQPELLSGGPTTFGRLDAAHVRRAELHEADVADAALRESLARADDLMAVIAGSAGLPGHPAGQGGAVSVVSAH
jgi:hypothetical protein